MFLLPNWSALCTVVLLVPGISALDDVHLRTVIAERGLDVLSAETLKLVNHVLAANITCPDIHLDEHVPEPIGHITLDLTNIRVHGVHIQTAQLQISRTVPGPSGATILLNMAGLQLAIELDYKWRKVHTQDCTGSTRMQLSTHLKLLAP